MKHKIYKSKNSAFSLVELMISLITISLISAAFAPIITKRLTKSTLTVSNNTNAANTIECNQTCATCATSVDNCTSCKGGYYLSENNCVTCPLNAICSGGITDFICEQYYTKDNDRCKRTLCPTGEYLSDETCLKCPENATCNGIFFTCNSGYSAKDGTCETAKQAPLCENTSLCKFSGDMNGDWLLTVNAASDRAGVTKIRFYENVNVDIFVNGSGGGGPGTDSGGKRWACFGISTTVKQYTIEAGDYSASVGKGGKGTSDWSPTLGSKTIFKTPDGTVVAQANGGPGWDNSRMNCYASSKRTKSFNEDTGTFYGSGGASATSSWAAGKDGKDGVLLIRNQRF